jgi:uncharacterized phage protein (predicted DNA packaging)
MKFLTLNEIKQQCRIEEKFTMEDTLLTAYGGASENTLLRICNRSYSDLLENFGDDDGEGGKVVPPDFRVAALLLAKHLYEHRGPTENVSVSMVPYALDSLIKPFMRLTTSAEEGAQS